MVEPVHPFEGCEFDGLEGTPRPAPMDDFGFVEAVDGLGQCIVIAVADTADGRLDTGFGQALRVFYGQVLAAPFARNGSYLQIDVIHGG